MRKRHIVVLSEEERARLHTMIGRGVAPASALAHARILLKANQGQAGPGWTDAAIGGALEVNPATVARVRIRFVAAGLDAAVFRKAPARQYRRKLDGEQRPTWSRWPAARRPRAAALDVAAAGRSAGRAGGRRVGLVRDGAAGLEENQLKPWLTQHWCIPPEHDAEFVWRMEDVLEVYTRPYDPRRPQVCLDETSRQLLGEVNPPLPVAPGRPAQVGLRVPARRGLQPVPGLRAACWLARRHGQRPAHPHRLGALHRLVDVHYPDAEKIVLVQDNLNTHTPASLYEAFGRRRPTAGREAGVALHAQARQLAEHGRDRVAVLSASAWTAAWPTGRP